MSAVPRLTIGVPVYNAERFIASALSSVIEQPFADFELIISDNASTDGTRSICEGYAARDSRVRYVRNDANRGAPWNFNRLVELARGEYFKWAMADDYYRPPMIGRCVEILERNQEVVVASACAEFVDAAGAHLRYMVPGWDLQSDSAEERLRKVIYAGGQANADALAGVIRRSALQKTSLFPPYQGGDKLLIAELALLGKFVEVPEYWIVRREHAESSGHNNPAYARDKERAIRWSLRFYGGKKGAVLRPTWALFMDHSRLIRRAELAFSSKLNLWIAVVRAMTWSRRHLADELKTFWAYRNLPE